MKRHVSRTIGLIVGLISMLMLPACAATNNRTEQPPSSSQASNARAAEDQTEASAPEKIQDAAKTTARETADAAKQVGRTLTATETEEARENARKQRQRNLESLGIGGGPVDSQTIERLDAVEKDTEEYQDRVEQAGDKLSATTRLRFEQVRQNAEDLREQYDTMEKESDLDVAALDELYEDRAEQIQDDWEDVSQRLQTELDSGQRPDDSPESN